MEKFLILDSNSILHRAFHALPPLTTKKGELVNAVYGFLLVFFKAIREFQPNYVAACFDFPALTFRHKEYKEYKAKRPKMPEDLSFQIPKVKEVLKAFNVPVLEKEGFEAEDLIGAISKKFLQQKPFSEIVILSGDSDTLQLVEGRIKVFLLKRGVKENILYNEERIRETYGLSPSQLIDFKALKGDISDNIPGLKGIGEKTALSLVKKFGNIENLYRELEKKTEGELNLKIKDLLIAQKERAFLNKNLVRIKKEIPLDLDLDRFRFGNYNKIEISKLFEKWGFKSLIKRIPEKDKNLQLL
jgi:DNA polymerase-1